MEQIHMRGDQVAGLCEQNKEPWGSIKCVEFFRQLRNHYLLEKQSVPWSYLLGQALLVHFWSS